MQAIILMTAAGVDMLEIRRNRHHGIDEVSEHRDVGIDRLRCTFDMVETRFIKDMRDIALRTELRLHIPAIAKVDIGTRHIVTAERGRSPSNRRGCGDIQQGDARQRRSPGEQRFLIRFHA